VKGREDSSGEVGVHAPTGGVPIRTFPGRRPQFPRHGQGINRLHHKGPRKGDIPNFNNLTMWGKLQNLSLEDPVLSFGNTHTLNNIFEIQVAEGLG
jgi:hypothetical protein